MKLIVFAHRGEAQVFIKELHLTPISFLFDGLYRNEEIFLLITGEGRQKSTEKVSATIGAYPEIHEIFNLGVCGALNNNLSVNKIASIRTIYGENKGHALFRSFTTNDKNAQIDLITTSERQLNFDNKNFLDNFAPLIDREAWGIGSACQLFKKAFYCIKIVSDIIGENNEVCQVVKDQSEEFSDRLYQYFVEHYFPEEEIDYILPELDGLYFTVSQRRRLNYLVQKLLLKEIEFEDIKDIGRYSDIIALDIRPKDRSKKFLQNLHYALSPKQIRIQRTLDSIVSPLRNKGFKVHFDPSLEEEFIGVHGKFKSKNEIDEFIKGLEKINFEKFKSVFKGQFEVGDV